jgi:hypothetical protein
VPQLRDDVRREWARDGRFTRILPLLSAASGGKHGMENPAFEYYTLEDAALWYVGGDMCDLLVSAATQLNDDVPLELELVPDKEGFVVFEKALAGLDAENLGMGPVHVGAMVWGRALFHETDTPMIGITCYTPIENPPRLIPIGSLIWPLGCTTDDRLDHLVGNHEPLDDNQVASMAEDRRRLLAMWFLSTQPGLATVTHHVDRAAARRAQRAGRNEPAVRVVQLRQRPPRTNLGDAEPGRTYAYQWTVSGHWRNQAYGPGWQLHRPKYINDYLKGDPDKPMINKPKVKAWIR